MGTKGPKRVSGSATILVVCLFSTIVILFLALFFLAGHNVAKTEGAMVLDISAKGVLAEFDREIEEKFGLYTVVSRKKAEEAFCFFVQENTEVSGAIFMDALSVGKGTHMTAVSTLEDLSELKKQISDFMTIRGLTEAANLIIAQFSEAQDGAQTAQEELNNYNGMEAYNQAYLEMVELVEGVASDGSKTNQCLVKLEEKVVYTSEEELESIAFYANLTSFYEKTEQFKYPLKKLQEAESLIEEGPDKDLLPLQKEDIKALQQIRLKNEMLLLNVLRALNNKENPSGKFEKLQAGYTSIRVTYEVHEKQSFSLTQLKKVLFGEAANLKIYAPNEDCVDKDSDLYKNLPSKTAETATLDASDIEGFSNSLVNVEWDNALFRAQLLLYIEGMMTNLMDTIDAANGKTPLNMRQKEFVTGTFKNELEYLLVGSVNEYQNIMGVKAGILAMRTVLNMVTLLSDSDKMGLIRTLAASTGGCVVPGIGEKVAEILLVTAWSLWEASSDWVTLVNGKKIALLKDTSEWKTDLDSILGTLMGKESSLSPAQSEGSAGVDALSYEGYVLLSLGFVSDEVLLKRIQDLIYLQKSGKSLREMLCAFEVEGSFVSAGQYYSYQREYTY